MIQNGMQDKEWMQDILSSQKLITGNYNTFANECATPQLRDEMLCILREEHDIQADIFDEMNTRGWYPTAPAEQQKVEQTRQKFASM